MSSGITRHVQDYAKELLHLGGKGGGGRASPCPTRSGRRAGLLPRRSLSVPHDLVRGDEFELC